MQKSKPCNRRRAHLLGPYGSPEHGNEHSQRSARLQGTQASPSALLLPLTWRTSSAVTSLERIEVPFLCTRCADHRIWFPSFSTLRQNLRSGARRNERPRFGTATNSKVPGPDGELSETTLASQGLSRWQLRTHDAGGRRSTLSRHEDENQIKGSI